MTEIIRENVLELKWNGNVEVVIKCQIIVEKLEKQAEDMSCIFGRSTQVAYLLCRSLDLPPFYGPGAMLVNQSF